MATGQATRFLGRAACAYLWDVDEAVVRSWREAAGVRPVYKTVDTCAAEFEASTPYHYSTYEDETEVRPSSRPKAVILGSGPNRIGQGIEFDYCCVHASLALQAAGFETVMVNCNPETVSTDYDTSDRLYFEPLTEEDVLNVLAAETEASGASPQVVVALGQTPLKLANRLPAGLIAGTSPDAIDRAEDRERWNDVCRRLGIPHPRRRGVLARGGAGHHRSGRLSRRPPQLRARRAGHADLLRRRPLKDAVAGLFGFGLFGFGELGREGGCRSNAPC